MLFGSHFNSLSTSRFPSPAPPRLDMIGDKNRSHAGNRRFRWRRRKKEREFRKAYSYHIFGSARGPNAADKTSVIASTSFWISLSPLKEKNPLMDEEERKKKDVNPDDFRQKEPSDADPKDEMEENIA